MKNAEFHRKIYTVAELSFEIREMSLAHTVGSRVERAYQRGEFMDQRRRLMQAWAQFCATPAAASGEVVSLRSA